MTTAAVEEYQTILSVGDTTFLDYRGIKVKREGYGPTGNGGNGLILHSALAIEPDQGQTIGLLWQKLWNREHKPKPPQGETPEQKKQRQKAESCRTGSPSMTKTQAIARKADAIALRSPQRALHQEAARQTPFEQRESYRWVEALTELEQQVEPNTRVIHVFDREGDITEVFDAVRQLKHTGILVRASHNRSLDQNSQRLWDLMESQPISFERAINLPATKQRPARSTKLAVRFSPVQLRTPYRFDNRDALDVYAVYATEIDCPEGETPLEWMLLTTEIVDTVEMADTILRWYTYRWRVEEYHKIFKSGCQIERYRLAAVGMKTMLGFFSVIAVELLQVTYLHRTQRRIDSEVSSELCATRQPNAPALDILTPLQIEVLKAGTSKKLESTLTVAWAVESVAFLGGYLEHRRKTPIGIQVLWRGWLKLHDLCQGWQLARGT